MCRHIIETYWKDLHLNRGYELLYSPHVAKLDLWKTSGHFDFYNENMFQAMQVCGDPSPPASCVQASSAPFQPRVKGFFHVSRVHV